MQDQFDAANFMGIARKNADYCDIYNFATKKDVKNSNNFYLNNIDLLEKYIDLLKGPLEKIITAHDLPKIYIPTIENPFDYDFNDQRVENFSDVVANTLIETQNKLGRIITKRELDCLQLIVQGFTAKEVARVLSISTRTVENYCEKLKIKFGCRRKQDLIALYAGVFNSTQSTR
jgi:DNA-binding CsgD family transcriptional regulator